MKARQPRSVKLAVYGFFACLALLVIIASVAHAHDWYTGTKSVPTDAYPNGLSCCGGDDCRPLDDGDVEEIDGGYYVKSLALSVPFAKAQASPDRHFHICIVSGTNVADNDPRCFFAPTPGS